jgi:hypothetical protein
MEKFLDSASGNLKLIVKYGFYIMAFIKILEFASETLDDVKKQHITKDAE